MRDEKIEALTHSEQRGPSDASHRPIRGELPVSNVIFFLKFFVFVFFSTFFSLLCVFYVKGLKQFCFFHLSSALGSEFLN